jgi:hypothetical protein
MIYQWIHGYPISRQSQVVRSMMVIQWDEIQISLTNIAHNRHVVRKSLDIQQHRFASLAPGKLREKAVDLANFPRFSDGLRPDEHDWLWHLCLGVGSWDFWASSGARRPNIWDNYRKPRVFNGFEYGFEWCWLAFNYGKLRLGAIAFGFRWNFVPVNPWMLWNSTLDVRWEILFWQRTVGGSIQWICPCWLMMFACNMRVDFALCPLYSYHACWFSAIWWEGIGMNCTSSKSSQWCFSERWYVLFSRVSMSGTWLHVIFPTSSFLWKWDTPKSIGLSLVFPSPNILKLPSIGVFSPFF